MRIGVEHEAAQARGGGLAEQHHRVSVRVCVGHCDSLARESSMARGEASRTYISCHDQRCLTQHEEGARAMGSAWQRGLFPARSGYRERCCRHSSGRFCGVAGRKCLAKPYVACGRGARRGGACFLVDAELMLKMCPLDTDSCARPEVDRARSTDSGVIS